VGFIAGASTARGLVYGHAGAVWWTDSESAESKKKCWRDAGIIVSPTLGEVGMYIRNEAKRLGLA
jgi:succinyl-CoA synthetase alpha subunit